MGAGAPELVRVSLATLECLEEGACRSPTAYLLLYSPSGCLAACRYCAQSRTSRCSRRLLSRVTWPLVRLRDVLSGLYRFRHLCIQGLLKPGFWSEVLGIVREVRRGAGFNGTISVALNPVGRPVLEELANYVDRVGVGLDAASPRVFAEMRKPYTWQTYISFARTAARVLGEGMATVHIIVGLGETPDEYLSALKTVYEAGCRAALFAYTPLPCLDYRGGRPPLHYYRWCQVARELADQGLEPSEFLETRPPRVRRGVVPRRVLQHAFITSGCPHCTRPYYNESPRDRKPYNYPQVEPLEEERCREDIPWA